MLEISRKKGHKSGKLMKNNGYYKGVPYHIRSFIANSKLRVKGLNRK